MTQMQHILNELEKASCLLAAASDLMKHGRLVSIASLKRMIDYICASVKEAGYTECAALKPMMEQLAGQLDAFLEDMNQQYGFLKPAGTENDS